MSKYINYAENRYERVTELELEFVKKYWCYGNLGDIAEVIGRGLHALRSTVDRYKISYNRGQQALPLDKLREIWSQAQYRSASPMIRDLPQEAVCPPAEEQPQKAEAPAEQPKEETPPPQTGPAVCPCHVDDTIIAKRINLTDGGELWVCARCGRQIALRRGTFAANMNK